MHDTRKLLLREIIWKCRLNIVLRKVSRWKTLSAKFLLSYVSLVQDPEITLDYEGGGSASIITNGGRTKLHGMDPEKFPSIPMIAEENPIILNAEDFRGAIDKTIFSAAEGNVRPMLAGIYMNATGEKLIFASTDSFRLSDYSLVPKNPISHQPIIIKANSTRIITFDEYRKYQRSRNFHTRITNSHSHWRCKNDFSPAFWKVS